jgi:hypothetical protein
MSHSRSTTVRDRSDARAAWHSLVTWMLTLAMPGSLRGLCGFAEPHAESLSLQRSGRSRGSNIAICQLTTVLVRVNGNPNRFQWLPVPEYVRS